MKKVSPFSELINALLFVVFLVMVVVPAAVVTYYLVVYLDDNSSLSSENIDLIAVFTYIILIGLPLLTERYLRAQKNKNGRYPTINEFFVSIKNIPNAATSTMGEFFYMLLGLVSSIGMVLFSLLKWLLKPALWVMLIIGLIWLVVALGPLWIIAIVLVLILLVLSNR